MKKIFFLIFIFLCFYSTSFGANLVYPIQEMSKVECRFQEYKTLSNDCKMNLPILKTKDYSKYKNDYTLYRRVYTVLWGSTYDYGWDVGNGGHQGVDIATAKGTPVYSIADGKVVLAGFLAGRGNTVKISHQINGKTIYSNYAHLSKIDVKVGDIVKVSQKIGEVGNTGNSYGNHLHFQIDTGLSGKGPWYRSNCPIKDYNTIVNTNTCFVQLQNNTVDPLLFLESGGAIVKQTITEKETISQIGLLSREEILKMEIEEFLKKYDVKVGITNFGGNIELGKTGNFKITVFDKRTKKPFNGSFPGDMNFKYDKNRFDIFPTGIFKIDNGVREFKITPKMSGRMTFDIYMGETFFKRINFGVFNTKKSILPKSGFFAFEGGQNILGEIKKGISIFRNDAKLNIIGVKYDGTYTLTSSDNSVKFCIKKLSDLSKINIVLNTPCREDQFVFSKNFTYDDTFKGILIFDYKVLNFGKNTFKIYSSGKELASKSISGSYPLGLSPNHPYYDEIISGISLGIGAGINRGYFMQDRDLNRRDGIDFIKQALSTKISNCKTSECKIKYLKLNSDINKEPNSKFAFLTRGEYLELIYKYLGLEEKKVNGVIFRDLDKELQKKRDTVLSGNTFRDYFGKTRYFQPTKNITRGEGMFLVIKALESK